MSYNDADRDLAIRTILGEEGTPDGQTGVAAVILNRLAAGSYGKSLGDVILAPNQFEPWSHPERTDELFKIPRDDPRYVRAARILDGVSSGTIPDPTGGATHFYAPTAQRALSQVDGRPVTPNWATGESTRLGQTMFYAPQGRVTRQPVKPPSDDPAMRAGLQQLGDERQLAAAREAPPDRPPKFMQGATRTNAAQSGQMVNALRAEGERRDAPPDRPPKFMSEAKPATISGQDGYLSTSLSEISRAPGEIWRAAREGAAEEKAGGAADVKEGVAAMRSGQPLQMLAGAAEDVRGTVRGLAAPLTGLAEGALYGLERTVDPQGLGLQPEEVAAEARPARVADIPRERIEPIPPEIPNRPPKFMEGAQAAPAKGWPGGKLPDWAEAPVEIKKSEPQGMPTYFQNLSPDEKKKTVASWHDPSTTWQKEAEAFYGDESPLGREDLDFFKEFEKLNAGTPPDHPPKFMPDAKPTDFVEWEKAFKTPEGKKGLVTQTDTIKKQLGENYYGANAVPDATQKKAMGLTNPASTKVYTIKGKGVTKNEYDAALAKIHTAPDWFNKKTPEEKSNYLVLVSAHPTSIIKEHPWFKAEIEKHNAGISAKAGAASNVAKAKKQTEVDKFYENVMKEGRHTDLPMDEESRLKRAKEQGFNTDLTLYHGTGKTEFMRFDIAKHQSEPAVFLTDDPTIAEAYMHKGGAPNIAAIWTKMVNPKVVDWGGDYYSGKKMSYVLNKAKVEGHDAVILKNMKDLGSSKPQTQYAFFEPGNLRAKYGAAFDPAVPASKAHMLSAAASGPAPKLPDRPPRETMWDWEDNFNRLRKSTDADRSEFANYVKALPEEIRNPETMQKFFRRMEDPNHPLTPVEEAQFRQYVEPLKREELSQWEEAKKTDLDVADYDPTYAHRIVKGKAPELDRLTGYDPDNKFQIFGGGRSLPQSTSSMKERRFFAIQSETGERRVVARDDDGNLSVLSGGKFQPVPSNLKMKVGDAFKLDGQTWTMEQARAHEVTAAGGPEYYENALVATIDNIMKLRRVNRAVYELNRLKGSPEWAAYARPIAERAPAGWRESLMPVFRGYRLEPRLANVIDDFYGHRERGGLVDMLGKINRWAVGTMFWSPVAHGLNATSHWATARAWDWINPVAYARIGKTMSRAIFEVAGQGEKYQALLREGNGLLYSSVANQKFYEKMLKDLGETIVRQPSRWGALADAIGVPVAALPKMLYEGSSRALWYWSDMLMMQRVLELEDKGMTLRDAVQEAERHIPSYRTRSELLGSRAIAQATYSPAFTEFSRYHVDMLNSWGNIIKDVAKGGKDPLGHSRRVEALGALVTTGVVGMFIWPAIDAGYKKVFGPAAKFGVRGAQTLSYPLMDKAMQTRWAKEHLPRYILDYYNGDADVVTTIINLYGLAPTTRLIAELSPITNFHDLFTGQNTIEPADIRAGRVGRVAGQAAEHIAEGTVQPYQVFERARQGGKDVLKSFAEQATGGSEPNRTGRQKVFTHQEKQAQRRAAHPKGFLESIFDRSPF